MRTLAEIELKLASCQTLKKIDDQESIHMDNFSDNNRIHIEDARSNSPGSKINNAFEDATDSPSIGGPHKNSDQIIHSAEVTPTEYRVVNVPHDDGYVRETWGKKAEFLLSVIGFAVDLGNVWRFPYICYRNGGGAFLFPYFIMLFFLGLPLFYMELCLGQYHQCGHMRVWKKVCPLFYGVGYAICFILVLVGFYYNTIISWALFYLFSSLSTQLPWASCGNEWNTNSCIVLAPDMDHSLYTNMSKTSAAEFFERYVLEIHRSNGLSELGPIKGSIVVCLVAIMTIVYFSLWKGIKSSGKAVWVTATLPYVVLFILLVRGCTLPGAGDGIFFYLKPQWHRLLEYKVWVDAAVQICFSLGPGFGSLIALASYNPRDNNCYRDAMITSIINCFTSFIAGFVVFSVLGYMSHVTKRSIEEIAVAGPGLVFVVYPEAVASLTGSVFWAIIFFLMLITLGLDSTFGGLEAFLTGFTDEYKILRQRRELFVAGLIIFVFLMALPTTTYGGQYVITLLDEHATSNSLLFVCLVELIAVQYCYGMTRFSKDVESMIGFQPSIFWKVCWTLVCPIFVFGIFIMSLYSYSGLKLGNYIFPKWVERIGWFVSFISIACIPAYMIYIVIITACSPKKDWWALIGRSNSLSNLQNSGRNVVPMELKETRNGQPPSQSQSQPPLPPPTEL